MKKGYEPLKAVFAAIAALFVFASLDVGYRIATHTTTPVLTQMAEYVHITDSSWFLSHFRNFSASSTDTRATAIATSSTAGTGNINASTQTRTAPAQAPVLSPEAMQKALIRTRLALALPNLRSADVNIICIPKDRSKKAVSGSGVIIDSRGIIITAAHVAQYFLLQDYPARESTTCVIRNGSPAQSAYTAQLIYISKAWVSKNAGILNNATPVGTGENDFAFLAITGTTNGASLPTSFPYVSLSSEIPSANEPIVLGSYAAEFKTVQNVQVALYPTLVFGSIREIYTFEKDTVDLIALGGGAAAQEGSSGGGVVNANGQLIGLITTSSNEDDFTKRDLHAITPEHIARSFAADMGQDLLPYLKSDSPTALAGQFSDDTHALATTLLGSR